MRLGPVAVLLFFFFCIGPLAAQDREQVVRLPGPNGSTLVATVMRPPGEAKNPLVVINHGSPADGSQRYKMERPRYTALSSWFLSRGYVVALPLRRGYGETGGDWAEGYGLCDAPDYYRAGLQGAADIQATIDFMRTQPYVAADRTLVVGQSAGGWATVALSSRNPAGVAGMINFAGGRGGHQKLSGGGIGNCTPRALVDAAGRYGATARVPCSGSMPRTTASSSRLSPGEWRKPTTPPVARRPTARSAPSVATGTVWRAPATAIPSGRLSSRVSSPGSARSL